MRQRTSRPALAALVVLGLAFVGCERPAAPTAPTTPAPAPHGTLLGGLLGAVWQPLRCSEQAAATSRGVVGPSGGTIAAGSYRIDFPAGAVAADQEFVLTVLAGTSRRIEARAEGFEHYIFAAPVSVTVDLRGCGLLSSMLHAWNVDLGSGALLEDMGGSVDLLGQRIRFRTPHFSGYTIAWRSGDEPTDPTSADGVAP